MPHTHKLSSRQHKFAEVYAFIGNGAEAARIAGYSQKTARQMAHENLTKPYILEEIEKLKPHIKGLIDGFIKELYTHWKTDITDAFNEEGDLKPIADWPDQLRRSGIIKSIVKTKKSFRIELHNRLRYPEMIAKVLIAKDLRCPG